MSLKMAMKQWELIGNVVIKQWILMDLDRQMDLDVFSKFSVFSPTASGRFQSLRSHPQCSWTMSGDGLGYEILGAVKVKVG